MPQEPVKLRISHKPVGYVGLPAAMAVAMAFMEATGIRAEIDSACRFDPSRRNLTPGMAVKAMVAPTFNIRNKDPLYLVEKAYRTAPVERIFGRAGLTWENLNDDALGRALDTLAEIDVKGLFHRISELCVKRFGFESHVYHMDCTNWSFYGIAREAGDGIAVPTYTGHPKDSRRDLLHYTMQVLTDSNRIIRAMMPADGNTSDSKLDYDMLSFIKSRFSKDEISEMTVVADSKLVTWKNVKLMLDESIGFVSRCPKSFGKKAQQRVKDLVRSKGLWKGEGTEVADVDLDCRFGKTTVNLRFMAVRREDNVGAEMTRMRERFESVRSKYAPLEKGCATEYGGAVASFESVKCSIPEYITVTPEIFPVFSSDLVKTPATNWGVRANVEFDEELAKRMAEDEGTFVLVTNLPRSDKDADNARDGVTAEGVRRLYDEEYVVEHSFRFMKSGLGIDSVYLQTPERENAMMFVLSVATLVCNISDELFRRRGMELDGRPLTMHALAYELQGSIVTLSEGTLSVMQPDSVSHDLFHYPDVLGINPQLLLGCRN